jgi:hypothetical protein
MVVPAPSSSSSSSSSRPPQLPSYESLLAGRANLWSKPKWAPGVLARTGDFLPTPGQNLRFACAEGGGTLGG